MFEGLQCIIGRFQKLSAIFEAYGCERIGIAKHKDGLISFLMLNVLEGKIFQYFFLEGHNVQEKTVIDRQHREM